MVHYSIHEKITTITIEKTLLNGVIIYGLILYDEVRINLVSYHEVILNTIEIPKMIKLGFKTIFLSKSIIIIELNGK